MQIRIYGFEWHLGRGITLHEFLTYLKTLSGIEIPDKIISADQQDKSAAEIPIRMVALTLKEGYWVGVFLTIKNMRAFVEIRKEGGGFKITSKSLEEGNEIADFNFLLIHPGTGRALYQHYHQSAAPNTFCYFCKRQYDQLRQLKIDSEIHNGGGASLPEHALKKIRSSYKGSLRYSTLVRQEAFLKIVNELKQISSFNFEFATFGVDEPRYSPLEEVISRISHEVKFVKLKAEAIKLGISELVSKNILKRGRVRGVDPQDKEVVYKLINNFDEFASYDYHDLVQTVNIDSDNLINSVSNSYIINELIKKAKEPKIDALLSLKEK